MRDVWKTPNRRLIRWKAFLLDARSLAVYRVGLGLILIIDCLERAADLEMMLGPHGIFPLETLVRYHGTITMWSLANLHDSAAWSGCVLALEGLAGAALAVGWHTRIATILGWVALVSVIRRGSPAVNSGDVWLACQMFWAMFLPLGARWSIDAVRHHVADAHTPPPTATLSVATVALVLQLIAVYLGAGLSKCNADWFTGNALPLALSVHDHGTSFGMVLATDGWLTRPVQWVVIAGEVLLPLLLLAVPTPRVRVGLVLIFIVFHIAIWLGMSVGLFPAVGIVAWLPLLPREVWTSQPATDDDRVITLGRPATWACATAGAIAAMAFVMNLAPWRPERLPLPLAVAVNLTALQQEWAMFGGVPSREQWVYGLAVLTDGTEVDILRRGRPVERDHPGGGFTTLANHRWHTFFWHLARPDAKVFAEPAARALAMEWNARHGPDRQIVSLEIRYGFKTVAGEAAIRDCLYASWPARSAAGAGNLDRFLQATSPEIIDSDGL
jgi:hypothetical protein